LKLPPYHSLEWAGYVTSHCRAQVYLAAQLAPDDILAFETDAVFSRVPLDLPVSERLGDWGKTEYADLTYLKSGMYFGTLSTGETVEKSRGITKGSLTREEVKHALDCERIGKPVPPLVASATRFITLGQALHQDFSIWTHWITGPRVIQTALNGKRIDLITQQPFNDKLDGWMETQEGFHDTEFSYPYEVEWINETDIQSPDGIRLPQLRINDNDDNFGIDHE
jgi:hypothetical protein